MSNKFFHVPLLFLLVSSLAYGQDPYTDEELIREYPSQTREEVEEIYPTFDQLLEDPRLPEDFKASLEKTENVVSLTQFVRRRPNLGFIGAGVYVGPALFLTNSSNIARSPFSRHLNRPNLPRQVGERLELASRGNNIETRVLLDIPLGDLSLVHLVDRPPQAYAPVDFKPLAVQDGNRPLVYAVGFALEVPKTTVFDRLVRVGRFLGFSDAVDSRCASIVSCDTFCCYGDFGGGIFDRQGNLRGLITSADPETSWAYAGSMPLYQDTFGLQTWIEGVNDGTIDPTWDQPKLLEKALAVLGQLPEEPKHPGDASLSWIPVLNRAQLTSYLRLQQRALDRSRDNVEGPAARNAMLVLRVWEDLEDVFFTYHEEQILGADRFLPPHSPDPGAQFASVEASWRVMALTLAQIGEHEEVATDFVLSLSIKYPLGFLLQVLSAIAECEDEDNIAKKAATKVIERLEAQADRLGVPSATMEGMKFVDDFGITEFDEFLLMNLDVEAVTTDSWLSLLGTGPLGLPEDEFVANLQELLADAGIPLRDNWQSLAFGSVFDLYYD